jgi:probable addiction module antidote protein
VVSVNSAMNEDDMAKLKTRPYDTAGYLKTERDIVYYLRAAIDDGDPKLAVQAFKNVSRAKGIGPVARRLRMTQTALRAEILPRDKPRIVIVMKLLGALGIKLTVAK